MKKKNYEDVSDLERRNSRLIRQDGLDQSQISLTVRLCFHFYILIAYFFEEKKVNYTKKYNICLCTYIPNQI